MIADYDEEIYTNHHNVMLRLTFYILTVIHIEQFNFLKRDFDFENYLF